MTFKVVMLRRPELPSWLKRRLRALYRLQRGIVASIVAVTCAGALATFIVHLYTTADNDRRAQSSVGAIEDTHFAQLNFIESLLDHRLDTATDAGWSAVEGERTNELRTLLGLRAGVLNAFLRAERSYEDLANRAWDAARGGRVSEAESVEQQMEGEPLTSLRSEADRLVARFARQAHASDVIADAQTVGAIIGLVLLLVLIRGLARHDRANAAQARDDLERKKDDWFDALLSRSTEMITVTDIAGVVVYSSPSVERWLGWTLEERIGKPAWELIHPDDVPAVEEALTALIRDPHSDESAEFRIQSRDGTWHEVEVTGRLVESDGLYIVTNYRFIDERKRYERMLQEKAFTDPLTGLANRNLLQERVERALGERDPARKHPMLALIDIDDFKTVNEGFGHVEGDRLLCAVGERLLAACRPEDVVARLGGDEFVVFTEGTHERNLADLGRRILDSLASPFGVGSRLVHLHGSIGLASGAYDLDSFEELLRAADIAMYRAKKSGKNRYSVFTDAFRSEAVHRAHVSAEIEEGIADGQFEVFLQPIVSLADGWLRSAETLIRWNHPTRGLLGPGEFIPIAEETGSIVPLGLHILELSCSWFAGAQDELPPGFDLHVNVAVRQLYEEGFEARLARMLKDYDLDAGHVVIEVTETGLIPNLTVISDTVHEIARLGCPIAIDDFGTGSASLSHLTQFPVNILKIDASFVRRIEPGRHEAPICTAVTQLGRSLGLEIVAEGIETRTQADVLERLGCEWGQGYLFGRPAPAASFIEQVRDQTRSLSVLAARPAV